MPKRQRTKTKNPAAVALGRLGGLARGQTVLTSISAERRREYAQRAARARWAQVRAKGKDVVMMKTDAVGGPGAKVTIETADAAALARLREELDALRQRTDALQKSHDRLSRAATKKA